MHRFGEFALSARQPAVSVGSASMDSTDRASEMFAERNVRGG